MSLMKLIRAGAIGLVLSAFGQSVVAQSDPVLRVVRGAVASNIAVTVDRAIVVESTVPVSELSLANPGIADVAVLSETNLYVLGRAPGRTTLTMIGLNGELIANVEIQVTPDLTEFKERLADILPGENIEVRSAGSGIVLSGRVSGARRINRALALAQQYAPENVTNLLTVGGSQQVMLKVRFAEVQRSVSQELGFGIGVSGTSGNFALAGGTAGSVTGPVDLAAGDTINLQADSIGALAALFRSGDFAIDFLIEALETEGLARTLAEPNVVALSGEEAYFLAGGEYPIPVENQNGAINIEYRPFGVQLRFLPTVVDEDLINLAISTEVSALSPNVTVTANGISVAAFDTRATDTTVEMRDGQSFAIAGLLQDDFNDAVAQVPILGDIPILGTLFRSANFQRNQTELVIIITPYLVSPTDGELLSLPTDRVQIPNERELFLFGRTVAGGGDIANQEFEGSYGYVLE